MTPIAELRELREKAVAEGSWHGIAGQRYRDKLHEALPDLLSEIERLTGERDALKAANDLLCEADQRVFQEINRADAAEQRCADMQRVHDAADTYYRNYLVDEAEDQELTGIDDQQHARAIELRDALAALAQTGRG